MSHSLKRVDSSSSSLSSNSLYQMQQLIEDNLLLRSSLNTPNSCLPEDILQEDNTISLARVPLKIIDELRQLMERHPFTLVSLTITTIVFVGGIVTVVLFPLPMLPLIILGAVFLGITASSFVYDRYSLSQSELKRLHLLTSLRLFGIISAKEYEVLKKNLVDLKEFYQKTLQLTDHLAEQFFLNSNETTFIKQIIQNPSWDDLETAYEYLNLKAAIDAFQKSPHVDSFEIKGLEKLKVHIETTKEFSELAESMTKIEEIREYQKVMVFLDQLEKEMAGEQPVGIVSLWKKLIKNYRDPSFCQSIRELEKNYPIAQPNGLFFQKLLKVASHQGDPFSFIAQHVEFWEKCQQFKNPLNDLIHSLRAAEDTGYDKEEIKDILNSLKDAFYDFLGMQVRENKITETEFKEQAVSFESLWKTIEDQCSSLPDKADLTDAVSVSQEVQVKHCISPQQIVFPHEVPQAKKRITVLISEGGGGHKAAGEAIKEILSKNGINEEEYEIEIINIFEEVLHPVDTLSRLTFGWFTGEDFWNFCLKYNLSFLEGLFMTFGAHHMASHRDQIEQLFTDYLNRKGNRAPDLIISTIPIVNCGLAPVADKKNIPYLIIPTDLDVSYFLNGLTAMDLDRFTNFKLALPYEDADIRLKILKNSNLKSSQVIEMGYPVRKAARRKYTHQDIQDLREKHGLYPGHKTVTLVMGAQGAESLFDHAKEIANLDPKTIAPEILGGPLEANICCGHSYDRLGKKITKWLLEQNAQLLKNSVNCKTFKCPNGVVIHLRGFTKDLVEIVACSELLITKTGSATVNEGIYLGKKLLLDNTPGSLARNIAHEYFNIPFVQKYAIGDAYRNVGELHHRIPELMKQPNYYIQRFACPDFEENLRSVVYQMIHKMPSAAED